MDEVSGIIQTSLLLNMKTGNVIIDAIFTVLMVYITKKIIELLPLLYQKIKMFLRRKRRIKSEYLIQGTITISTEYCSHYINFPDEYKAIMYQVSKNKIDIRHGRQFNQFDRHGNPLANTNHLFSYSLNTNDEIKLTDDIRIRQDNRLDKSSDLKSSIEFYNLYIYSHTLSFSQLKKIIDGWINDYKKFIKEYNDGKVYYFSYQGKKVNKDNKNAILDVRFESHEFYSNKNFDNIFFEQKAELFDRLNFFIKNEDEYAKLGIPYTLGLLFHGAPGCGKTSTIKAIANYTNRHIIEIPLSKVKTCAELKKIFFIELINSHYVPSNKKIIVLEDIDCMSDIVHKRDTYEQNEIIPLKKAKDIMNVMLEEDQKSKDSGADMLLERESKKMEIYDKLMSCKFDYQEEDKITLSYILNLIDGILEQRGRIIIITTNYPEKLDNALLRPGRIDMKLNFRRCNRDICKELISFYYKRPLNDEECKILDDVQEYKWTPAEVFQMCLSNPTDIYKTISQLSCNNKKP